MSQPSKTPVRLSDYIMRHLADAGVRHIFLVTGGGAMHLNDAIAREERISYTCNHHEQASAIAAEGYARTCDKLGVVNVTAGPGGINALNGVFGAFTDSVPMLVISGQAKRETCMASYDVPGLRQLGDQEVDIVAMAKPITKYAKLIMDPNTIRFELEKALHLATSGRPGPCWLDIPVDVQSRSDQSRRAAGLRSQTGSGAIRDGSIAQALRVNCAATPGGKASCPACRQWSADRRRTRCFGERHKITRHSGDDGVAAGSIGER